MGHKAGSTGGSTPSIPRLSSLMFFERPSKTGGQSPAAPHISQLKLTRRFSTAWYAWGR